MNEEKPDLPPSPREDTPTRKEPLEEPSSISEAFHSGETHDFLPPRAARAATPTSAPQAFGRYVVAGVLGQGAFGTVYKGHDTQLDRPVAIKVQRADRALLAEQCQEFIQEARRLARLRHPGIVAVHDMNIQEDLVYIVSDFVQGVTLKQWLKVQRLNWQESVRIIAAVADALSHAHAQRVVHRDVKPANIILTTDMQPILVDFGLGLDDAELPENQRGMILGTPAYMSPEQATGCGHRIDGRTDIYSLGVVLYELITGHVPFRAALTEEVLRQVREDEPQPPRQLTPQIPRLLETICLTAMAKRIQDRFTTAADLAEELRKLLSGMDSQARSIAEHPTLNVPAVLASAPPSASWSAPAAHKSAATSSVRLHEPERRQLTLLLTRSDLFETAEYLENLDDEEQLEVLRTYQQISSDVVQQYEGAVLQMTEQGMLACFGYPTPHEDSAARAVKTGLGVLRAMTRLHERLQRSKGILFTVSIHVHTGMCVVSDTVEPGRETLSVTGEARNVISRLDHVAKPDAVVISQTTYKLVQGYFECASLGATAVKGAAKPLEFFHVARANEAQGRIAVAAPAGLTPLIGRDREVGLLQERWEQAIEGMGQIVLLIGEAGLGKSRLIHVLKEQLTQGPPSESSPVVEWRCTPQHQSSGLYPAIDFFERWLRFERDETPERKFTKLHDHLQRYGLNNAEVAPFLAALLSLPLDERYAALDLGPARLKEKTLEALRTWLHVYASKQPVLFIVEDLHWVDPSTLEFLALHVASGLNDRMLTLMTFRPEFETPWKSRAHQTVMALNRLTKRQITDLMQRKTGVKKLPPALVEQMAAKTDGVPLFVEEYTKMIMESGRLRETDGERSMSSSFLGQEIPATLQDLLAARLNRMASNREVVQLGATLGREFTYELLRAVSPLAEEILQPELTKLVAAELLYQKGTPPHCSYTFKHALIQDAAYLTLLKSKRQQVHQRVAEVLEQQFEEVVLNQPELLAHHFTEAGNGSKGVAYWARAGLRSKDRSANEEAVSHFHQALDLLAKQPETPERIRQELLVQIPLGTALIASQGYAAPAIGPVFERARALCLQLGDTTSLMAVLWGIWAWRVVREELDLCLQDAAEVMRLAESQPDRALRMEAHFVPALTLFYRGDNAQALAHCQQGIALYDEGSCRLWSRFTGQNSRVTLGCYQALSLWQLGYPDQALRAGQETIELAQAIGHPYSLAFAWHHFGWLQQYFRLGKAVQTSAETALALANEQGFPFWKATGSLCRAGALLLQQRPAEALEQARPTLTAFRAAGAELSLAHYYSYLAEAHRQLGQHAEALRCVNDALAASAKNRNEFFLAEIHRLKGEILWAASPTDLASAEACFHDAVAVAVRQQAKSWELRAAMSLGRLWDQQGRRAEARLRLAAVHGWFSEGFTTADLLDAKKLLDAWA